MNFISVGYGNIINTDRVISVSGATSSPAKRLIQEAKDAGRCIDVTQGRRTKSIIMMDSDHLVLSALRVSTVALRLEAAANGKDIEYVETEDEEADDEEEL